MNDWFPSVVSYDLTADVTWLDIMIISSSSSSSSSLICQPTTRLIVINSKKDSRFDGCIWIGFWWVRHDVPRSPSRCFQFGRHDHGDAGLHATCRCRCRHHLLHAQNFAITQQKFLENQKKKKKPTEEIWKQLTIFDYYLQRVNTKV